MAFDRVAENKSAIIKSADGKFDLPVYYTMPTSTVNENGYFIIDVHGGPHCREFNELSMEQQFWTSRGYPHFKFNPRGSAGLGIKLKEASDNHWFDVVDDIGALVKWVQEQGLGQKPIVMGASFGAYAAIAAYEKGITDIAIATNGVYDLNKDFTSAANYVDGSFAAEKTKLLQEFEDLCKQRSEISKDMKELKETMQKATLESQDLEQLPCMKEQTTALDEKSKIVNKAIEEITIKIQEISEKITINEKKQKTTHTKEELERQLGNNHAIRELNSVTKYIKMSQEDRRSSNLSLRTTPGKVLLIAGMKDTNCLPEGSIDLFNLLKKRGDSVELVTMAEEVHSPIKTENKIMMLRIMETFAGLQTGGNYEPNGYNCLFNTPGIVYLSANQSTTNQYQ
jgi:dipeptidyl aminopeptidase/acylaminoacyl peptidase